MSETQPFSVDPTLFTRRVIFSGVLHDSGYASPPFSMEIAYSVINEHKPFGLIKGGHSQSDSLYVPMMAHRGHFSRLESTSPFGGWATVSCNDVRIRALERGPASEPIEPHVIRTIADFEFSELTLRRAISSENSDKRTIAFFLIGPAWPWQPTRILRTDQYGNAKIEELDPASPISGIDDVSVSVRTQHLPAETNRSAALPSQRHKSDPNSPHREFRIGADVCTIEMRDRLKGRTCDDFLQRAIQLVDGMALAASFLSKASLTWYSYHLHDSKNLIAYYRRQQNEPDKRADWEELVINPAQARAFISTATSSLIGQPAAGIDIKTIIILYLTAQRMPFLARSGEQHKSTSQPEARRALTQPRRHC
jgi:hypothetical protein